MRSIMNEMKIDSDSEDSDIDKEDEKLIQALANGTFDLWEIVHIRKQDICPHTC